MSGFEFDMLAFLTAGRENAAAVIFLVLALTYLAERFGAHGRVQLGIGMGLGFVLGAGLQAASLGWPADFAGWFWLVVYGMVMAVLPSGLYDLGKAVAEKGTRRALGGK